MIFLYKILTSCLFLLVFPMVSLGRILGIGGRDHYQRFGMYENQLVKEYGGKFHIWIHASSVGEVQVAENIIRELHTTDPLLKIIVSTTTRTGQTLAKEKMGNSVTCIYAPLDFISCIRQALDLFQPDMVVFVETEIWPNWLSELRKRNIPSVFVNGRISKRALKQYIFLKSLFTRLLTDVARFSMISKQDADHIQMMGAPADRVIVNGNAKFDRMNIHENSPDLSEIKRLMNLGTNSPIFVAGCTRPSEEEIILDVYGKICKDFHDLILIIAPRHVERTGRIEQLTTERGYHYQLRTDLDKQKRTAPIVIVNTIGELQHIYGLADVVFCGGSLASFGGHNILEPAAWGKPVLYGPFMDDFKDAAELLTSMGGGLKVDDGDALLKNILSLLSSPDKSRKMGEAAQKAVAANRGAARKHAEVILEIFKTTVGLRGGHEF